MVLVLTNNSDSVFMRCIGPPGRRNGHQVVGEVVENVNVLPVVEDVRRLGARPLDEPSDREAGHGETVTATTFPQRIPHKNATFYYKQKDLIIQIYVLTLQM